jgi:hypothetical protein
LNPALWSSPDLQLASGYQRSEYLYGPTQYLTIAVLLVFDSYKTFALALLIIYLPLLLFASHLMWQSYRTFDGAPARGSIAVFASTALFLPLLQAYAQREFEVVILFLVICAQYALLTRRKTLAGAFIGYAAWFKFFPLAFLFYFAIRRWRRATAGFLCASLLTLGITEVFLGLSNFQSVVDLAGIETMMALEGETFCEAWSRPTTRSLAVANSTRASIRWALCSFQDRWAWISARSLYACALAVLLGLFAVGYLRIARGRLVDSDECWRRSIELSLFLIVPPLFLHAHYYYLLFTIVPLNALLVRYLGDLERGLPVWRFAIWCAAYALLGAFVIPPSLLSEVLGADFWRIYMRSGLYFFGEAALIGLLLWEYLRLGTSRVPTDASLVVTAAAQTA